ncbi:MAG: glycosyltransferase family 39 protein [Acidobacteriota bacterium]
MHPAPVRTTRIAIAAAVLVVLPLLLMILQFGAGRDQGVYLVAARAMESGGLPYRDVWDIKPPGIYFLYGFARTLGGGGMTPVRALECAALASQIVAFALLTRRFIGSIQPGLWGGALAVILHAQLEFWHTGQPESFGGPVLAWALVLASTSGRHRRAGRLAAGALFGAAGLLKPPLGGALVSTALILAWREARSEPDRPLRAAASVGSTLALGAILPVAATLAWFGLRGGLPDMAEVFRDFVPRYTALAFRADQLPSLAFRAFTEWLFRFSSVIPAGIALLLWRREPDEEGRWGLALIAGVLAPQILGIALQAKFFEYHYGAALPFGALLAGWGAARGLEVFRGPVSRGIGAGLLILLMQARPESRPPFLDHCVRRLRAAISGSERIAILDALQSTGEVDAAANREAAAWLRRASPRDARVFVWGYEPVIYEDCGRLPASRYVYNAPQRAPWYASIARPRLLSDLALHPPAAIVVERGDVIPQVTGDSLDSDRALESFAGLRTLLETSYEEEKGTARFRYFRRGAAQKE